MMKAKMTLIAMLAIATFSVALCGAVMENGKAAGKLIVAGKAVNLKYAYAKSQKGFFDPKTKDTLIILTDVPLDNNALADEFIRSDLAKAGKLHVVEVIINSQKQPISVTIKHEAFRVPCSGGSTEDAFEPELFDAKAVAGRVFRTSPGEDFDDISYTYDVRFHASIK